MALAGKSDCKFPNNDTGIVLYKTAEGSDIDVVMIEKDQKAKPDTRAQRVKDRVKDLQKRKSRLKN